MTRSKGSSDANSAVLAWSGSLSVRLSSRVESPAPFSLVEGHFRQVCARTLYTNSLHNLCAHASC